MDSHTNFKRGKYANELLKSNDPTIMSIIHELQGRLHTVSTIVTSHILLLNHIGSVI